MHTKVDRRAATTLLLALTTLSGCASRESGFSAADSSSSEGAKHSPIEDKIDKRLELPRTRSAQKLQRRAERWGTSENPKFLLKDPENDSYKGLLPYSQAQPSQQLIRIVERTERLSKALSAFQSGSPLPDFDTISKLADERRAVFAQARPLLVSSTIPPSGPNDVALEKRYGSFEKLGKALFRQIFSEPVPQEVKVSRANIKDPNTLGNSEAIYEEITIRPSSYVLMLLTLMHEYGHLTLPDDAERIGSNYKRFEVDACEEAGAMLVAFNAVLAISDPELKIEAKNLLLALQRELALGFYLGESVTHHSYGAAIAFALLEINEGNPARAYNHLACWTKPEMDPLIKTKIKTQRAQLLSQEPESLETLLAYKLNFHLLDEVYKSIDAILDKATTK